MYNELKEIYDYFEDEESKMIFRQRLLYGLTGDWKYIKEMLLYYRQENKGWKDILDILAQPDILSDREIILFGTGSWGGTIRDLLQYCNIDFHFYCDNAPSKIGKEKNGKRIISFSELMEKHRDAYVIIATDMYELEIMEQLQQAEFPDEQIVRFSFTQKQIYIDDEIVRPQADEIFVDAGCYDGNSSLDFIQWTKGHVKKIYAFEPDERNYENCKENLDKNSVSFQLEKAGLWSEKTTLHFCNQHNASSRIDDEGDIKIPTLSLDEVVGNDKVTFIKMDIEGAELEALKGAVDTIKNNKPRLAICLYHKPEDVVEIPRYVKELVPEYKMYIRHYLPYHYDTILYAVVE